MKTVLSYIMIIMFSLTFFPSCDDDTSTNPWIETACDDGIDNDNDGFIDCNDQDCFETQACNPVEICNDGIDNDNDGFTDCKDADCDNECDDREICNDETDNDNDGYIDCDDQDCLGHEHCEKPAEICDDGIDNDDDGYTDCEDTDCADDCGPVLEHCGDGIDNDGDGFIDCADPDCAQDTQYCGAGMEWDCTDGLDNDGDGLTDCEDTDCYYLGYCPCDPIADSGCPMENQHCYARENDPPVCIAELGTLETNSRCTDVSDCVPGNICMALNSDEPSCIKLCDFPFGECPESTMCQPASDSWDLCL
ncbi:hypothetical protein KKF34_13770 [Myxococcota bacterium]|nr:hypothetical protein [Myxococcota bacterium]MBU1382499.1 hypothetical protein [Myxococcota bacterium]MBU1497939.1 hypothetical protein [Myxococcota bacterium]